MRLSELPKEFQDALSHGNLIVFDGECVFCSGFFQFILKRDLGETFQFATAQSDFGQQLFRALGLPATDFETLLVVANGAVHEEANAVWSALGQLGGIWRLSLALRWVPRWLSGPIYRLWARNRYRMFGRFDVCMVPDDALERRFVSGGWT